jgi:putative ABC transport system ATP-binding protein
VIAINNLYFSYPDSEFKLSIPLLTIEEREKVAIIGPSGFGKTTLLNLFAGILSPEKGEITIDNKKVQGMTDPERRAFRIATIGFVFQDFKLMEYLKVKDNILLPFRINKHLQISADANQRVDTVSDMLGIRNKLDKYPSKLSQGEQQRVAIGRALINKPSIILADEPTGNLDPVNKDRIKKVLFESAEEFGATLITVTHDHELLKGFDRVIDFRDFQKTSEA